MKMLIYCSTCGEKNVFGPKDGGERFYCNKCNSIHYQNPKPTATLICPRGDDILLVKRAFNPGKGEWNLPGGFLELGETLEEGAKRDWSVMTESFEIKEGKVKGLNCVRGQEDIDYRRHWDLWKGMCTVSFSKVRAGQVNYFQPRRAEARRHGSHHVSAE